jgi:hypothetical protein
MIQSSRLLVSPPLIRFTLLGHFLMRLSVNLSQGKDKAIPLGLRRPHFPRWMRMVTILNPQPHVPRIVSLNPNFHMKIGSPPENYASTTTTMFSPLQSQFMERFSALRLLQLRWPWIPRAATICSSITKRLTSEGLTTKTPMVRVIIMNGE